MTFKEKECKGCYYHGACLEDETNNQHINCPGYTKGE